METDAFVVPRDGLIAEARRAGIDLTPTKLLRWCNAGLLPHPKRRGLGRGRGVVALYPAIVVWQVLALGHALKRRRSLDHGGWVIWVLGFSVTPFARRLLLKRLREQERALRATARALGKKGFRDRLIREARRTNLAGNEGWLKALDPSGVPVILELMGELELGTLHKRKHAEEDLELLQDAVLSVAARRSKVFPGDPGVPSLAQVEEGLNRRSQQVSVEKVIAALKRTDDETLCELRTEAQTLYSAIDKRRGWEETVISPDDFRGYFTNAVVVPDGPANRKLLLQSKGWPQPALTKVEQWIRESRHFSDRSNK